MFLQESFDVFCEGNVVMRLVVGRVAVVSCIDCIDGTGKFARKDTEWSVWVRGMLLDERTC